MHFTLTAHINLWGHISSAQDPSGAVASLLERAAISALQSAHVQKPTLNPSPRLHLESLAKETCGLSLPQEQAHRKVPLTTPCG